MSLISEALKRHERNDDDDDNKDKASGSTPAAPAPALVDSNSVAPPDAPDAETEDSPAPKRKLKLTKLKKAGEAQPETTEKEPSAAAEPEPAVAKPTGSPIRLSKKKVEKTERPPVEMPGAPTAPPAAAPAPPPPPAAPPPPPTAPPPPPSAPPVAAAVPAPAITPVKAPEQTPAPEPVAQDTEPKNKKKKDPKPKREKKAPKPDDPDRKSTPAAGIIIAIIILLLIGGGVFIAMQVMNGTPEDGPSPDIPPVAATNATTPGTNHVVDVTTNNAQIPVTTNQVVTVPTNLPPAVDIAISRRARVVSPHDIDAIALHPRSRTVATLAGSASIHFWDAGDGSRREELKGKDIQADTLLFDNSGKHLILNRAKFRVLDTTTQNIIQSHDWLSPRGTFEALDVSLNGELAATGATSGKSCLIWSLVDGRLENEIALVEGSGISHITLAPDGRYVAIVDNRDTLQIYDASSGKHLKTISNNMITRSTFSSTGKTLAYTFESVEQAGSSGIVVLETVAWEPATSIETGQTLLEGLTYAGNTDRLISVNREGLLTVWNPEDGTKHAEIESGDGWTFALAASADARTLVTATRDKVFNIWDLNGIPAAPIRIPRLSVSQNGVKVPPNNPVPLVKNPPKPEPVQWPSLKCEGFMGSGEKGSVIINGRIITVGGKIEGATVTAITAQSVELDYKGERRRLKVGNSTR